MEEGAIIEALTDSIMELLDRMKKEDKKREVVRTYLPGIPIGISNRHIHLSPSHIETLFGPGHRLQKFRDLYQPGEFACKEKVILVGPKGKIKEVRVLGPPRTKTQVELLRGDVVKLGIEAPVRDSGNLFGTPGITVVGPQGIIRLDYGVIIAQRHIHMSPRDTELFGVKNGDLIKVRVPGARAVVFEEVLVRVKDNFRLELHLDIEEANAALVKRGMLAELVI